MGTTTTYDIAPLENFKGGEAFQQITLPLQSYLGTFLKFGTNSNGDTVFQYVDPDKQQYGRRYNKLPPDQWGYSAYDYAHPLVNPATGTTDWPLTYSDGTPVTNKTYMERQAFLSISPDGRTLQCNVPSGSRTVDGFGSNTKWVLNGSGASESLNFSGNTDFVSGSFSTPVFGIGKIPTEGLTGSALSQEYIKYAGAFANLATGVQQRIRSYTVTDTGLIGDITATIAKLGPLAPIALSVAMPGVGSAIAGALGLGSAAAGAAIGNALLATALNGGDLAAGLKAGLASYAGASLGGLAGDLAKGGDLGNFLANNPTMLSGIVNNVTQTAIKGGDVKSALAGAMLSAGVSAATTQIEGFKDMPPSVQATIQGGISQALQGKDINVAGLLQGAAMNAMVSYGLSQIPGYESLDQKYKNLAATSLSAALQGKDLTKNAINWALNQANQEVAKAVADDKAVSQGWKDSTEKAAAEKVGADTPQEFKEYKQNEEDKANGWESTAEKVEAEKEGFKDADEFHQNESDKEEGWSGTVEKTEAEKAGFDDPTEYRQDLEDKSDGWTGTQEKLDAEKVGADTPADWKEYKADKSAEELGWVDREQKEAAEALDIHTPADYKYHLDDEAAKTEGWDNLIEKQKAEAENVSAPAEWKEIVDDRDAQSKGWLDREQRDYAYTLDLKTPDAYKYYVDDQDAKSAGWEGIDAKNLAEKEGIQDPSVWHETLADRDAQSNGWADREEQDAAKDLSIFTPDAYKYHLSDEQARGEGWSGVDAKNDAAKENITDPATWTEFLDDRDAKSNGWIDSEERDAARDVGIEKPDEYKSYVLETNAKAEGWESYKDKLDAVEKEFDNPNQWHQFLRDEDAKSLGFDDDADRKEAEDAGFTNSKEWDEQLDEDRIIKFFEENADREPTPEELQRFRGLFGDAKNSDEFSDDQIKNLIYGDEATTDYVYGPNGERYDSEADAVANGVFDFTDEWSGPVYGSDGNQYDSAADAIANGVFDFTGERPADYVEPEAPAEEVPDVGEQVYEGHVWGPDGTEYPSVADALAEGVFDYSEEPPVEPTPEEPTPEEPTPEEPAPEEPAPEEPAPEEPPPEEPPPEEPAPDEETGPDEPIVWEEDEEEPLTCEPGFHDDGNGLCVPDEEEPNPEEPIDCGVGFHLNEDGVCESDDVEEETVCEPGFHDDGTGLCVADDDEAETDCGVGFHLNADGVCESDDATSGGTTDGGTTGGGGSGSTTSTRRQQILQNLAKKALASPEFQSQVEPPLATVSAVPQKKKKPPEQLGGTSIYPSRFRSVLQDYLEGIEAPSELTDVVDGISAPLPAESLNQPVTMERYGEPDMANSNYFSYGEQPDLDQLVKMQQEQNMPLGEGLAMPYAQGGMVAPLLMARGGTGHGKNAHGALSIVEHSGKHRIDYRQGDAVTGAGDGQSDDIPAMLADGEFVIPADVVAALGNGSTKAGSDKLYEMMHSIRKHHRAAKPEDLPPPAKQSPLAYVKTRK